MTRTIIRSFTLALLTFAPSISAGDTHCPAGTACNFAAALARLRVTGPTTVDRDMDGIPDAREAELARRYAPVVLLDPDDWTRPASVQWLLDRLNVGARYDAAPTPGLRLARFAPALQRGSPHPRDWKTYVHSYASRDGRRLYLQYWFFYPYNDGKWVFNHEGDWEHVTVTLDSAGRPLGVHAAQHGDNAPGEWRRWQDVPRVHGTHPKILSAKGSHASYFDENDVGWRDSASRCDPGDAACANLTWRTWRAGGLAHLGELRAPLQTFLMKYRGHWGAKGSVPGTRSPKGPAFQSGWCFDGYPGCTSTRR